MPFNDEDFDFENGLSDEEKAKAEKDMQSKTLRVKNHPLMLQAKEIAHMLDVLLDTCNDATVVRTYGPTLRESAMMMTVKLGSALASDFYLISMQNAAIIRDHAEYLRLSNHTLKMSGGFDDKYIRLFREEMEKFRSLFKLWAKEIHKMDNDFDDEWGLFVK